MPFSANKPTSLEAAEDTLPARADRLPEGGFGEGRGDLARLAGLSGMAERFRLYVGIGLQSQSLLLIMRLILNQKEGVWQEGKLKGAVITLVKLQRQGRTVT